MERLNSEGPVDAGTMDLCLRAVDAEAAERERVEGERFGGLTSETLGYIGRLIYEFEADEFDGQMGAELMAVVRAAAEALGEGLDIVLRKGRQPDRILRGLGCHSTALVCDGIVGAMAHEKSEQVWKKGVRVPGDVALGTVSRFLAYLLEDRPVLDVAGTFGRIALLEVARTFFQPGDGPRGWLREVTEVAAVASALREGGNAVEIVDIAEHLISAMCARNALLVARTDADFKAAQDALDEQRESEACIPWSPWER